MAGDENDQSVNFACVFSNDKFKLEMNWYIVNKFKSLLRYVRTVVGRRSCDGSQSVQRGERDQSISKALRSPRCLFRLNPVNYSYFNVEET